MAFANHRTRYENELIRFLTDELGEDWFGQRGTHSLGIDVLLSRKGRFPHISETSLFEVKTMKSWPFYLSKRNRDQYSRYQTLLDEKGVEVIYAIRIIGSKTDKWRFAPISLFETTRNGHPKLGLSDTIGVHEVCILLNS